MNAADPGPVYLDSASAEPLHPAARDVLLAAFTRGYADPRRLHGPGRDARLLLDNAREVVAQSLGVRRDEVHFTSSGTSATRLGLLGLAEARRTRGRTIVHSEIEHQAVHDAAASWGPADIVGATPEGRVRTEELIHASQGAAVAAVALQHANHEVGTIQDVDQMQLPGDMPLFVDACASMGRLALPQRWDAAAGSARKWGGPGGVGVLLVRKRSPWLSPLGLPVEHDFTNIAGALAAAAALQASVAERAEVGARQRELIDLIRARVALLPDVEVVGDPVQRLPHLVTFSFLYVDGEALVTALDRLGFGLASGSACASDTREPSRVLAAMGVLTHGNLRLSLTRETTRAEVERFLDVLPATVAGIRAEAGL